MFALRQSQHAGFATEHLLLDRSQEAVFEGVLGTLVPVIALLFISQVALGPVWWAFCKAGSEGWTTQHFQALRLSSRL